MSLHAVYLPDVRYDEELTYEQACAILWILSEDDDLRYLCCDATDDHYEISYCRRVSSLLPLSMASQDEHEDDSALVDSLPRWLSLRGPDHLDEQIEELYTLRLSRQGGSRLEIVYAFLGEVEDIEPSARAC